MFKSDRQTLSRIKSEKFRLEMKSLCTYLKIFGFALHYEKIYTMAIRVVEISNGGTKLERFLHTNLHNQRKLLNFENWINGGLKSFQKSEF